MRKDLRMLDVLIASPGDAKSARDVVERALRAWNDHRADTTGFVLRPGRWEITVPISGRGDAQTVINMQLVDKADIVFGIFYHRLGTATARAASGTAEEIDRSVAQGKFVHLYFATKKRPHDVDADQLKALREFQMKMEKSGLVGTFKGEADLYPKITQAIEHDIIEIAGSGAPSRQQTISRPPTDRSKRRQPTSIRQSGSRTAADASEARKPSSAVEVSRRSALWLTVSNKEPHVMSMVRVATGDSGRLLSFLGEELEGPDVIGGNTTENYRIPPSFVKIFGDPDPLRISVSWRDHRGMQQSQQFEA